MWSMILLQSEENISLDQMVETLISEVEESLVKLEKSLGLKPEITRNTRKVRKLPHPSVKQLRKLKNNKTEELTPQPLIAKEQQKFDLSEQAKLSYFLPNEISVLSKTNASHNTLISTNSGAYQLNKSKNSKTKNEPKETNKKSHQLNESKSPTLPKQQITSSRSEQNLLVKAIESIPKVTIPKQKDIIKKSEQKISSSIPQENKDTKNLEQEFFDILPQYKLIHVFGKPGSGKTTFALQCALDSSPTPTYYFVSDNTTPLTKRINQMLSTKRWEHIPLKKHFFLVPFDSLEDLKVKILQLQTQLQNKPSLIVIDYLVSHARGLLYKEEIKEEIRNILEQFMLIAERYPIKILLLNGVSYSGSPIAEDLFEGYCDMTIELQRKTYQYIIFSEDIEVHSQINDSGFSNLTVNIFFS